MGMEKLWKSLLGFRIHFKEAVFDWSVNKLKLGKLEEVDIRELWKHEQYDFPEWLSKEEYIEMLSDEIGLTLTEINCWFLPL